MKTHIDIDATLLASVQELGGYATKREAVHAALEAMAQRLSARQLLAMRGSGFEREPPSARESRFPDWDGAR